MLFFVEENGRFPSYTNPGEEQLSVWVQTQRRCFKGGKLPEEQIKLLKEINFPFSGFDDWWQKNYDLVKEYIKETGEPPTQKTVYKDVEIGMWFNRQIREMNTQN